jgi:hypothetical protein
MVALCATRFNIKKYYVLPTQCIYMFLRAFTKLRRATIIFVMCICLSFRMERLDSNWTDFDEI